jgi:phosphoribosyl-ATP pyrophosphohydrolase
MSTSVPVEKSPPLPGYHVRSITPGVLGELSKIQEELDELADAQAQGSKIMMLVEMADLYGALQLYLEQNFSDVTMEDLARFSAITRRAFTNGRRASKG